MSKRLIAARTTCEGLPKRFNKEVLLDMVSKAPKDETIGIRHVALVKGKRWGYHIAEITEAVRPHVHLHGLEVYYVIQGQGRMHTAKAYTQDGRYNVSWDKYIDAKQGDTFIIPAGYAHSLENTGRDPLIIVFRCPDAHLSNVDRFMINNDPPYVRTS